MAISQARPERKQTGARYKDFRKRTKHELGRSPTLTKIGPVKLKTIRVLGGNTKTFTVVTDTINLIGKDQKSIKAKIKSVLENEANRHFVRRNILTKGTVVETDNGKAKITSRPGQDGTINAVLL